MKRPVVAILLIFLCSSSAGADDAARKSRTDLEALLKVVDRVLPPGWLAKISPADPSILISHERPLSVVHRSVGSFQITKRAKETVTIRLIAVPSVSTEEHKRVKERNQERRRKRKSFEDKNLSAMFGRVRQSNKIERPFPPSAYSPQSEEEKLRVIEYAFLWMNTQPENLARHWFKTISLDLHGLNRGVFIEDEKKSKQYRDIILSLEKIVTPFK